MKNIEIQIGVLAIQGSFQEHITALQQIPNVKTIEIRSPKDLTEDIRGLVIPGGESTTMGHFLKKENFLEHVTIWMNKGDKFVWGTCAGLILLADEIHQEKEGGQCKIGGKFHQSL